MAIASAPSAELLDLLRKPFYSPGEVAALASLSSSTILNYIHEGKLASVKLSERTYRIPRKAVIRLLGVEVPAPIVNEHPSQTIDFQLALTPGQLRRRRDRVGDYLDVWGDVQITDVGGAGKRRIIEFALEAPGYDLPVDVKARYREYYRIRPSGDWVLAKYHYEYLDVVHGRRLAYHLHDIGTRRLVPHAHCEPATDLAEDESPHHLRAVELDLREAHARFMAVYATEREPDCGAFLPLDVPRTIDQPLTADITKLAGRRAGSRSA